jgi:outer membrane murein-binding lipoprotein Lpp
MKRLLAAAVALFLIAGCSSRGSADRSTTARTTLQEDVHELTALAADRQYTAARGWLAQLQQDVMYARASGAIGLAEENQIGALLERVQADLVAAMTASHAPSAARSSSTAPPRPTAVPVARRSTPSALRGASTPPSHRARTVAQRHPARHAATATRHRTHKHRTHKRRHHRTHHRHHHRHRHHHHRGGRHQRAPHRHG